MKTKYGIFAVACLLSSAVFAEDAIKHEIKTTVEVLAKSSTSWAGETLPNYPSGTPEVTILRIVIPPKTKLPMHKHPYINAGVLLSGELIVTTEDNKTKRLKKGEALIELVNRWHYGENISDEPAEIIVVYAGEKGEAITIKK